MCTNFCNLCASRRYVFLLIGINPRLFCQDAVVDFHLVFYHLTGGIFCPFPAFSSGASVDLRSRCGGRRRAPALKKPAAPRVPRGKSTQGLTAITGAPSARSRRRKRGSQAAAGGFLDPAGMVGETHVNRASSSEQKTSRCEYKTGLD